MQLKTTLLFLLISSLGFSQDEPKEDSIKIVLEDIEITILSSYYEQDGIHSPVTGGLGTEKLSNIAPVVYVHVPLDSVKSIDVTAGVDFYTSASSDNIDNPYLSDNHISGASADDIRQHYSFTYSKKNNQKRNENSFVIAASSEYDVTSISGGYGYSKESKNKARQFAFSGKYFFDDWKRIYPVELRNGSNELLSTDKRHTLSLSATEMFIINKKMNASITVEALAQSGMLSTPFHRVYFSDLVDAKIEILPALRVKLPVAFRYNVHLTNNILLRTFNRLYWDSWDVKGYTAEVELPIKIKDAVRVYPFYRFHVQTASTYFAAHGEHLSTREFYTSDYDLSGLNSHKYGMGIKISPLYGIGRFKLGKKKVAVFKEIDLRFANYNRSDGLNAWTATLGLKFNLKR
jgi:hypothetical protein